MTKDKTEKTHDKKERGADVERLENGKAKRNADVAIKQISADVADKTADDGSALKAYGGKVGLVLEGGGVKGAYEAGVLEVLDGEGYSFDGVCGTSIGAINAALYVDGGVPLVKRMWDEIWAGTVIDMDDEVLLEIKNHDVDRQTVLYMSKKLIAMRKLLQGSSKKSERFFSNLVSEERIRAANKQFGVVTYCLTDRQPVELLINEMDEGKLVDLVIASATFPIFPPKVIDGKKYIDGGVYDNMPVNLLSRGGFKKQLVVRTNVASKKPKRKIDDDVELFYIMPEEDLGHAMAFTSANVKRIREIGRAAALSALENGLREFLEERQGIQI